MKIPKQILLGSDMSIIGFPQCGNSYYLLMQLDKEFQPVFHLLEAQWVPPAERINSITDVRSIIRVGEIDVGHMPVTQDDLNTTSLIKWEKIQMMLKNNLSTSNQIIDNGLEPVLQLPFLAVLVVPVRPLSTRSLSLKRVMLIYRVLFLRKVTSPQAMDIPLDLSVQASVTICNLLILLRLQALQGVCQFAKLVHKNPTRTLGPYILLTFVRVQQLQDLRQV